MKHDTEGQTDSKHCPFYAPHGNSDKYDKFLSITSSRIMLGNEWANLNSVDAEADLMTKRQDSCGTWDTVARSSTMVMLVNIMKQGGGIISRACDANLPGSRCTARQNGRLEPRRRRICLSTVSSPGTSATFCSRIANIRPCLFQFLSTATVLVDCFGISVSDIWEDEGGESGFVQWFTFPFLLPLLCSLILTENTGPSYTALPCTQKTRGLKLDWQPVIPTLVSHGFAHFLQCQVPKIASWITSQWFSVTSLSN
jgi:hypothetical protein